MYPFVLTSISPLFATTVNIWFENFQEKPSLFTLGEGGVGFAGDPSPPNPRHPEKRVIGVVLEAIKEPQRHRQCTHS